MSGIALLLRHDGAPAEEAAVRGMLARLRHRGEDGERLVAAGSCTLGHRHFWATPEEVGERQPLADPSGRFWIACDGRVDNRDELLAALDGAAATSDAVLLLQAFVRWGVAGFARTVGSFAVAVWDAAERRLTLARDALGDRTLAYARVPGGLVAASEPHAVLAHPDVDAGLDERRIAQFLALAELDGDATFFAAVKEVLPGHALVVEGGKATPVRYWEAAAAAPLRLADDREYAEAFAERLDAAVRAQLRSTAPVALQLSGGLDSSAIAASAALLAPRPALTAVSWVFDELPSCDERAWIDAVVRHCGLEPLQFPGDGEWPLRELASWRRNPSSPEGNFYRRLEERARSETRAAGRRVVLSGMYGDHLYGGTHGWLWERLAAGPPGAAFAAVWQELRASGAFLGLRRALLPRRAPAFVHSLRRSLSRARPWLTERAAGLVANAERWPESARTALRPAQCRGVLGLSAAHGVSGETFHAASAGVEVRYPFRDRRLVELALRLPSEQLDRPGLTRPVLREALRGRLPEASRMRVGKTSIEALFRRGIVEREQGTMQRLLAAGESAWGPLVRREWVHAAPSGARSSELEELVLCRCALLGHWLDKPS